MINGVVMGVYTDSVVFFCLPLQCVMMMESPPMAIAFASGRGRDLGQWDPAIGTGPLRDFADEKTNKGGGPFQFLPVPCGDPKPFVF